MIVLLISDLISMACEVIAQDFFLVISFYLELCELWSNHWSMELVY
jgi:hypothetical protein